MVPGGFRRDENGIELEPDATRGSDILRSLLDSLASFFS
jgi:hypothetical protein